MTDDEIVTWVRKHSPYLEREECLKAYEIYKSYRDEGQSEIVSRQYAGLI